MKMEIDEDTYQCPDPIRSYKMKLSSGWIRVKNKPEEGQQVLMTYNDLVMEGKFANGKFYYPSWCAHTPGYCNCEAQQGITHFMPLPNPPEENE